MKFSKIKPYLYALLTTIAFFIDAEKIYKSTSSVTNPFVIGVIPLTICFVLLFNVYMKNKVYNPSKLKMSFGLLLSFFMVMGNSYLKINSWNLVFGNLLMMFISLISFIGFFIIFMLIINKIDSFIENNISKKKDIKIGKRIKYIFEEHPFWSCFFIIIACWLIYIVAFYPIVMSPDPTTQVMQFYNLDNKYASSVILLDPSVLITNHHPVLYTLFLGGSTWIGNRIGNGNLGLFIYTFIQVITMASIYAYSIKYMKKLNSPFWLRIAVLTIYSLVPMFPLFSIAAVKDTFYTGFIILYTIFVFDTLKFFKDKKISWKRVLGMTLLGLLICLYRNNGVFIVLFSLPFLILKCKNNFIKLGITFIAIISIYMGYNNWLLPHYKITNGSIREALSIPFQQTARYVKYYGDELTDKQIAIIDKVLDYDTLVSRYNPVFADSVKDKFNKYTTDEDLKAYFELWGKLLLKHPAVYIQATTNNVYGYFYPHSIRWYLYYSYDSSIKDMGLVNYHFNKLGIIRQSIGAFGVSFPFIPVVGLLANVGFNCWCVLFMLVYYIVAKKKEYVIVLLPMLISILICIASPVNTYFRYTMPFVFLIPFMWSIFIYSIHHKES